MEKKKDDQQNYLSRIENALENTSKDYLKLKQNFENELEKKTKEIQSYVTHLEKDLEDKTEVISESKPYVQKLEEIIQHFEWLKKLEQNRPKYYSSRL